MPAAPRLTAASPIRAWQASPVSKFLASAYLLNASTLMGLAEAVESDAKTKARLRFAVEQWMAASAPSNFLALNAEAQKKAIETKGESIAKGLANLLHDMKQGHVSMTDESMFEVGKNVATTEGAVVFENEFFQLLEYKPLTDKVYEKPFLMVPPCINKFYILDLQPENSLIRYAVGPGPPHLRGELAQSGSVHGRKNLGRLHRERAPSRPSKWCRTSPAPTPSMRSVFAWAAPFWAPRCRCWRRAAKSRWPAPRLLTSLLDFTDTGILDIFIDETSVKYREAEMGKGGLLKGKDLASTFSFLRPNDLVWNYVVGNYLKGETPPPFDLLYWNSDSTNLPGPFYAWYLRNTYFENNLIKPGKTVVCGEKVDLGKLDMPVYIYGSREDHIVPIGGAYASTQVLPGKKRFVMGASGHIAGVINPPAKKKRSYWTNDKLASSRTSGDKYPAAQDDWQKDATEHPGSWWTDWSDWLQGHAGKQIAAPKTYGSRKYKAIEPAPGRYVKVKA